jgi:alpha-maltose-1-phosphate synthase
MNNENGKLIDSNLNLTKSKITKAKRFLRISIMTTGRFHVGNLARELSSMGHEVNFYSMVPRVRLLKFGLPANCIKTVLLPVAHWFIGSRYAPTAALRSYCGRQLALAYDRAVSKRLTCCDVFIGMSGIAVKAAEVARMHWGAKVFIERGSRHILSQQKILSALADAIQVSDWQVERELASYAKADVVTVLSKHCEESFTELGFQSKRLFLNPLGVQFSEFPPADRRKLTSPTVVMAGTWCWRKGADLISAAAREMSDVKFIHVGSTGDHAMPLLSNFEHIDKVDQIVLKDIYAKAHVFCLPSREEGMATVIPQALATGLRVVCSDRTGGEDLTPFMRSGNTITIFQSDDLVGMINGLRYQLKMSSADNPHITSLTEEGAEFLTWRASAERYSARLSVELETDSALLQ